jgi:hypothetical protein
MRILVYPFVCLLALTAWRCRDAGEVAPVAKVITSDGELYSLITVEQPYPQYTLFPNADSVAAGTLNGSNAHQPFVRVSLNEKASGALVSGKLPPGRAFPDGSIIVKEIRERGSTTLLAVMYRDRSNLLSGLGWLWAEYRPDGTVAVSIQSRGSGCVSCHSREQGPQHDLVRTFERQNP